MLHWILKIIKHCNCTGIPLAICEKVQVLCVCKIHSRVIYRRLMPSSRFSNNGCRNATTSTSPVPRWGERQGCDNSPTSLLTHLDRERCPLLVEARLDVSHGNVFAYGRSKWDARRYDA